MSIKKMLEGMEKELEDKLNSEEYWEEVKKEEELKQAKIQDFIDNKQIITIEQIYNNLKINSIIDDETMSYCQEKYEFLHQEFNILFDLLINYANENYKYNKVLDYDEVNWCLKYKELNIILRELHGQGTCRQMRTDLEEDWSEKDSFTWEQYLNNNELNTTDKKREMVLGRFNNWLESIKNDITLSDEEIIKIINERND